MSSGSARLNSRNTPILPLPNVAKAAAAAAAAREGFPSSSSSSSYAPLPMGGPNNNNNNSTNSGNYHSDPSSGGSHLQQSSSKNHHRHHQHHHHHHHHHQQQQQQLQQPHNSSRSRHSDPLPSSSSAAASSSSSSSSSLKRGRASRPESSAATMMMEHERIAMGPASRPRFTGSGSRASFDHHDSLMPMGPIDHQPGHHHHHHHRSSSSGNISTTSRMMETSHYPPFNNSHRRRMSGPVLLDIGIMHPHMGDDLHHPTSMSSAPPGIGNGFRGGGPLPANLLHMEGANPNIFGGYDDEYKVEVGGPLGHENPHPYRGVLETSAIDRRLKGGSERRAHGSEASSEGMEDPRLSDRRTKSRESRGVMSMDRSSDGSARMGGASSLDTVMERKVDMMIAMEKRVENSEILERRSGGAGRPLERRMQNIAGLEASTSITDGQLLASGSQRRMENALAEIERRPEKRLHSSLPPEPGDDRVGSRALTGWQSNLFTGRITELEYEDVDSDMDGSRGVVEPHAERGDDPAMQELVAQYKMALGELTFNSKPIITNLTIIAGENLHASKVVASTVCAHILEVPVEQKLPSLYLLDSIVKNIGNEYVKYFSSRLREVFVKSYRQVDPALHPSMQHLFKTWRSVFSKELLEAIESELHINIIGNPAPSNVSVPVNIKRADDSSTQQPGHSIHVNPKYLEVRKDKMQQASQGLESIGFDQGKNMEGGSGKDSNPKHWDMDFQRGETLRSSDGNSKYGFRAGFEQNSAQITEPLLDAYGNVRGVRAARIPPGASIDDVENRSTMITDKGVNARWLSGANARNSDSLNTEKDEWYTRGGYRNVLPNAFAEDKALGGLDQVMSDNSGSSLLGNSPSSLVSLHNSESFQQASQTSIASTLASMVASLTGVGQSVVKSQSMTLLPTAVPGIQRIPAPAGPPSPPSQQSPLQQPHGSSSSLSPPFFSANLTSLAVSSHTQEGQSKPFVSSLPNHEPTNIHESPIQIIPHAEAQLQQQAAGRLVSDAKAFPQAMPQLTPHFLESLQQLCSHLPSRTGPQPIPKPFLPEIPTELSQGSGLGTGSNEIGSSQDSTSLQRKLTSSQTLDIWQGNMPGPENVSSNNAVLQPFPQSEFGTVAVQPPLPSGPPPLLSSQLAASLMSLQASNSSRNTNPPLPPGPPPMAPQATNPVPAPAVELGNSYTSLLSSLMAQGIITAAPAPALAPGTALAPAPAPAPGPGSVVLHPVMSANSSVSTMPVVPGSLVMPSSSQEELVASSDGHSSSLLEFRPELLRERHEPVIMSLYLAFPRQCTICGLRFKQQEEHSRHMDWHVARNRQRSSKKVSRRWFMSEEEWLMGTDVAATGAAAEVAPAFFSEEVSTKPEDEILVAVPADENQITCFLCGEPFEDFYSDETEEWMYRGAVYMNGSPDGGDNHDNDDDVMNGSDQSSRGPIVHAKCRSETTLPDV